MHHFCQSGVCESVGLSHKIFNYFVTLTKLVIISTLTKFFEKFFEEFFIFLSEGIIFTE